MVRGWRPLGLLPVVAVLGALAVATAPTGTHAGELWPVGLASAMLLLAGPRAWAYLLALAPVTFAAYAAGGRPLDVSAFAAVGVCAEVTVVWLVLTAGGRDSPRLRTFSDLDRYAAAAVLGAATATAVGFVSASVTGFGSPPLVALTTGASHLSSQLVVLPFFLRPVAERASADRWEQALSWVSVVVVTPLVFLADGLPALGFLVMPLLVWGALRLGTWQALAQVVTVAVLAYVLYTAGRGPITWVPDGTLDPADAATVLLQLFVIGCALVVIPLVLMVSLRSESDRGAASERDRLARVVSSAGGVAIIGTDAEGAITLFNPGAERLLGYRPDEVLGRRGWMFHTSETIREKARELGVDDDYPSVAQRMIEPDQAGSLVRFRRKDGQERAHRMTLAEIRDDRGERVGYVSTSEDVTEQVETQEALERALQRMKEADSLKDSFISTVSHELRTPVTSIVGYLELLGDDDFGALSSPQRDAVSRVQANSARLLNLIDDLLTLARMQDGRDGSEAAPDGLVSLGAVVAGGRAVVAPQAAAEGVELSWRTTTTDDVSVIGDRDALEGVVINLVANAVKFTERGGRVTVELGATARYATLVVADTGIGIPADELDLLFTRFYRSSVVLERQIQGSGLGLSIAQGVVRRHGGEIEVTSVEGEGTTFTVTLPRAPGT